MSIWYHVLSVHLSYVHVRSANSKPELSQLLFISVRQRELVRVLASLVYLLIHNLLGLCT